MSKMCGSYFHHRLGRRLHLVRSWKNLSQEELAVRSRIDRSYLARIEEGKVNPSLRILYKLSLGLQITVAYLLQGV